MSNKGNFMKLDLIGNAKSSLEHAVAHLIENSQLSVHDYKFVIKDLVNTIELLFKEKLKRIHPAFMWKNINKYPSREAYTVTLDEAKDRLFRLEEIKFDKKHSDTIGFIKKIRNEIEHYEFEIEEKAIKTHIGRLLSFIFWFSSSYLSLNFEQDLKHDDSWSMLTNLYEFFLEYVEIIEDRMSKENINIEECPNCGGFTFDMDEGVCEMCNESSFVGECENCRIKVFEYNLLDFYNGPEAPVQRLCEGCFYPP